GALSWEIINAEVEGVTISGGEPFLQAEALAELIKKVRKIKDIGVIIYTGYLIEELSEVQGADKLLELTDLLIDGPYVSELDDGKSLRGSSNQRVIPLSERYNNCLEMYGADERKLQVIEHLDKVNIVGIPQISLLRKE
ncbi:MAG: radical SAM protein, partial [Clostridia bacterium]|nr:radical SAM protein [Clostridia bacterium]